MTLLSVIKGSTYLKKHNSLRKRSKRVKITKYVEQTFGEKNPDFFGAPPALKRAHGGVRGRVSPLVAGFEGVQLALIIALVWLLHGHRLRQFVSLGGS